MVWIARKAMMASMIRIAKAIKARIAKVRITRKV